MAGAGLHIFFDAFNLALYCVNPEVRHSHIVTLDNLDHSFNDVPECSPLGDMLPL